MKFARPNGGRLALDGARTVTHRIGACLTGRPGADETTHRSMHAKQLLALAALGCGLSAWAGAVAKPAAPTAVTMMVGTVMTRPAAISRRAAQSVLLGIAAAGRRLVAVGERGRVLLSDDAGATWRQSQGVPVSVTLTAVTFVDEKQGWAVGHAGVVLYSADGGETWRVQLDGVAAARAAQRDAATRPDAATHKRNAELLVADGPDKPFLAVHFISARSGFVAGAYGLVFSTDDGGASWKPRMADVENPKGLHFNAIHAVGPRIYLAGERGLLLRSDDGRRFNALASPYEGSWFAIGSGAGGALTLAGLRGNVFHSADGTGGWQKIAGAGDQTFSAVQPVGDGLLLVTQSGMLHFLDAQGNLRRVDAPLPAAPITALAEAADGAWVAATLRGPVRLPIKLPPPSQATTVR